MGGKLAMIEDATQNAAIVALIDAVSGQDRVWIGLNDKVVEGSFTWVRESDSLSQIPLGSYAPWDTGQPATENSFQDCVHLVNDGKWSARTCDQTKYFICSGIAPPPSPPTPPTPPPPDSDFGCFGAEQLNTMIASNAISQHSTDTAALDACIAAGAGVCGGVAYNPGVEANIQWSARGTGSTFTMNGVSFWAFTGCRRRRQLTQAEQDEMDPAYQASLPSDAWWKDAYTTWAHANAAPALPPYQGNRRLAAPIGHTYREGFVTKRWWSVDSDKVASERRLAELEDVIDEADLSEPFNTAAPDLFDDHHGPWATPVRVQKKPRAGPLWGMFGGLRNPNDRI